MQSPAKAVDMAFAASACGTQNYKPDTVNAIVQTVTGYVCALFGNGFTPSATGSRGTPLTVTTSDSTGTLPTGGVAVVTNVGTTNPMYCNVSGAAATVSDQYIGASGGWFAFTVPSGVTALHCISTGGSTTANILGGSGLPTGVPGGVAISGGGGVLTTLAPTSSSSDALSHASTTTLGTSLVVSNSDANLYAYNCSAITGGSGGFCIAYNGSSVPGTGALTGANVLDFCFFGSTSQGCSFSRIPMAVNYGTGIVILISTAATPYTYTTGTATGAITADYK